MSTALVPSAPLAVLSSAADAAAARHVFDDYRRRKAAQTIRRQDADLALFATFLVASGANVAGDLATDPAAWRGLSWGLVAAFVQWQLQQGYAVGSVNVRLSTVKAYAKLAMQAGALAPDVYAAIRAVGGYQHAEGKRVDARRETTRRGAKKAEAVSISPEQAATLKMQADPMRRLLMCVLLDHGLRVGEVVLLTASHVDLRRGLLRNFYRPKVDKHQTHRLTKDTAAAAADYLPSLPPGSRLFPSDREIRRIVAQLGAAVGLPRLSPHDARHYWATAAIAGGTDLKTLQDAGGWNSPAMPLRYAESAEIANDGLRLG